MNEVFKKKKIPVFIPIILSIVLGGVLLLSGLFLFLGLMASDSGTQESKFIATMIMLTPLSVLAGLIMLWISWTARKPFLLAVSFLFPAIWWGLIMLISWVFSF